MHINIQGQEATEILVETDPEKGLIGITTRECFPTALFTPKEAMQVIAAIRLAVDFVRTWDKDHAAIYEQFRAKHEKMPELCGRVYSGVACDMPKGSKCPDCGPACHDYPAGE